MSEFENVGNQNEDVSDAEFPTVSIIIPVRNEEDHISECLNSILANDYPQDKLEVLVIDGQSEDSTVDIVKNYINDNPGLIKLINNPKRIVPTAMNIGISEANGDIITRIDGHSLVAEDFVAKSVDYLKRINDADCVGGPVKPIFKNDHSFAQRSIALGLNSPLGAGSFRFRNNEGYVTTLSFGAYKNKTFSKYGKFDERFVRTQDFELNHRIIKSGGKIYMTPAIKSYYCPRDSIKGLWSQYFQFGFWKNKVMEKHRALLPLGNYLPPFFILALVGSLIVALFSVVGLAILMVIVGMYLIFTLTCSLKVGFVRSFKYTFLLPVVFCTIHVSFGLGFWVSCFKTYEGKLKLPWKGF